MATKYISRSQTAGDAYRAQAKVADRAQNDYQRKQLYNRLLLQRAALYKGGTMAGALPDISPNSSLADLVQADQRMQKLAPKKAPVAPQSLSAIDSRLKQNIAEMEHTAPQSPAAARPAPAATPATPAPAGPWTNTVQGQQRTEAMGKTGLPWSAFGGFDAKAATPLPTASPLAPAAPVPQSAPAAPRAPYVPTGPNGEAIRIGGSGWQAETTGPDGVKKFVPYTPTVDQAMDHRTNGEWGTMTPEQRGAHLKSLPMPLEPKGRELARSAPAYIDSMGNLSPTAGGPRPQTLLGIDMNDGTMTMDGTNIRVGPGTIVGGAGITPVTGGHIENRPEGNGREIVGGQYMAPGTRATSTFSSLPAPTSRPMTTTGKPIASTQSPGVTPAVKTAQGSQLSLTAGVKASPTNPGTNLQGPASSTGVAYQTAPRPPVPTPITSSVSGNAGRGATTSNAVDVEEMRRKRAAATAFVGF